MKYDDISKIADGERSIDIKRRVNRARALQRERYAEDGISCNARLTSGLIDKYCRLGDAEDRLMREAFDRLGLSARAHGKILKVARTIADLDGSDDIKSAHIAEAIQYRNLDRMGY